MEHDAKQIVAVIGAGAMGRGIIQLFAQSGHTVKFFDTSEAAVTAAHAFVSDMLHSKVDKGRMSQSEVDQAIANLVPCAALGDIADCNVVVEAVLEDLEVKQSLFAQLEKVVSSSTILASNTSSLLVTDIAAKCKHPEQVAGLHFFNPVQLMQLVEVVRTEQTSAEIFKKAMGFATDLGKTPIECIDTPGFVVNRLLVPYLIESIQLVERGVASAADVDTAMRLGAGHPMGPIQLADYIGLDTCHSIIAGWAKEYPTDPSFRVAESLAAKVAEGKLGRKSGEGFYKWDGDRLAK